EPADEPDAQLGARVAERRGRLLEQLDRALVGDPRAPTSILVADRGAREQVRVIQLASDLRRLPERLEGSDRLAGAMSSGPELEQHLRAPLRALDPQLERGAQARHRLLE